MTSEVVFVLTAVAAPVAVFVAGPVMVCVTPLESTEMVTGTMTTDSSSLGGDVFWVNNPFKNCSSEPLRSSSGVESRESGAMGSVQNRGPTSGVSAS